MQIKEIASLLGAVFRHTPPPDVRHPSQPDAGAVRQKEPAQEQVLSGGWEEGLKEPEVQAYRSQDLLVRVLTRDTLATRPELRATGRLEASESYSAAAEQHDSFRFVEGVDHENRPVYGAADFYPRVFQPDPEDERLALDLKPGKAGHREAEASSGADPAVQTLTVGGGAIVALLVLFAISFIF